MTSIPARPVSTTAPAWMTWIGIVLLAASVAIAIGTVSTFLSLLPIGVLDTDGSSGERVVASGDAGSIVEADLDASTDYMILLIRPDDVDEGTLVGSIIVTDPDGTSSPANRTPGFTTTVSGGGLQGESFTAFRTSEKGTYQIAVPPASDTAPTSVFIVEDRAPLSFVGGVLGSIGGVFAALLGGLIGLGLTIGGSLWWRSRRRARLAASPMHPAPPAHPAG